MAESIATPRVEAPVPKIEHMEIRFFERRDLLALNSSSIAHVESATGCLVHFTKDTVELFGLEEDRRKVRDLIRAWAGELTEGQQYLVRVTRLDIHGAYVELVEHKGGLMDLIGVREGFIHMKNYGSWSFKQAGETLKVGQTFRAVCIGHEPLTGRPEFSIKSFRISELTSAEI